MSLRYPRSSKFHLKLLQTFFLKLFFSSFEDTKIYTAALVCFTFKSTLKLQLKFNLELLPHHDDFSKQT
jgi:hypothetical protein